MLVPKIVKGCSLSQDAGTYCLSQVVKPWDMTIFEGSMLQSKEAEPIGVPRNIEPSKFTGASMPEASGTPEGQKISHLVSETIRSESPTKSADPLSLPVAESDLTAGHFQTETTELTSRSENEQEYSRLHASNVRGRYRPTRGQGGRLYSGESSSASHFTPLRNPHGGLSSDRPQQKAFSGSKGSTGNETSLSVGGIRTAGFAMAPEKKQSGGSGIGGGSLRLTPQYNDSRPVKVVDDSLHWDDRAADMLLDQTDFLVVGVIGHQAVGKSMIMSLLAGARSATSTRFFKAESEETQMHASHETVGIDLIATTERILLLDTEPIMSSSVLFQQLTKERFLPSDATLDKSIEIQSLQVASFIMSVCHVVVVVTDNVDQQLFRFLETAEMLKPTGLSAVTPPGQRQAGSQLTDVQEDFVPHVVFVYNKANGTDFQRERVAFLHQAVDMESSRLTKLTTSSGASMMTSGILPFSINEIQVSNADLNLFLFPKSSQLDKEVKNGGSFLLSIPHYKGHPSFHLLAETFRNQIFHLSGSRFIKQPPLTERQWFRFAARCWSTIKKSSQFTDFKKQHN
ncbi:nonsense-mediated mRNA decay factor SMG9-like [Corticium candelabrum]|uniref:nonsense-mediated mRNA decay factor SMG9-like n=1 Tax=Corticium candelabrum TaxID=121492 RepID=UPI002E26AD36|nr:nonsense-mediated mRNA decay factor SMG9-like [Corticium candelabrum]